MDRASAVLPIEIPAHLWDKDRPRRPERSQYAFATKLLPASSEAGRWVDLGCGQGEFLELATARSLTGFGLDYWRANAAAVATAGRPALVADLNVPLPFKDASIDGAALIEVLEHIIRAEDLVRELARAIRPGGWLILTTPNVAHIRYRFRAVTGHPPKQEGYHFRFFTRRTLRETLVREGFEPQGSASFGRQTILTHVLRLAGRGRKYNLHYVVPRFLESLLAQHFVWRLRRSG